MNQDVANNLPVSQEALEQNLINALTRLQYAEFNNEFLNDKSRQMEELPPEAFFGFAIGQYSFLVPANCFCEVFVDTHIAALPNAPTCLVGLSNIRGVLMPVYQLHAGLKVSQPKKMIIFCVGKGDAAIGILIDELPISLSLSANQRLPQAKAAHVLLQPLVKAAYFTNDREWLLLNGNKFAEQLKNIAQQTHIFSASLKNTFDTAYP